MQNNTNNYNNHHGDYFLTMSLRINTESAKYAWCAVKCHKSYTVDRFHSRDRWPQWGVETIRNI